MNSPGGTSKRKGNPFPASLSVEFFHFDAGLLQHGGREFVCIPLFEYDSGDPGIDEHFGTDGTGMVRAIQDGSGDRNPVVSGLDDGILFGVEPPAQLMAFARGNGSEFTKAADIKAMVQTGRRTVVTRGQDLLVLHKDGSHLPPEARGPFGHEMGDVHKVLVPGRTVRTKALGLFLFQGQAMLRQELEISDSRLDCRLKKLEIQNLRSEIVK
jgi:hypothetical protein